MTARPQPVKRVAIACRWLDGFGGTTTGILERTKRFIEQGWEVHCFAERLEPERLLEAGAVAHRLLGWPWGSYLKRRFFAWNFERACGYSFDLIEGHGDTLRQDVLMLHNCVHAAHEAIQGTPMPESSGLGRLHARMLRERRFRRLIANSELMKRDIVARFGVPADAIRVIYPGFDARRFRSEDRQRLGAAARQELGVRADRVLVGLVTSGDFRKRGVGLFLKMLAGLRPELRAKTRGLVIGKEKNVAFYERQARELGLGPSVRFVNSGPQVERLYHALDIFLYPALFEEFGQSVQEAMACGLPVLSSRRVGACEIAQGETARSLVLDMPEPGAFVARLEELIAQPELRRRAGEEGRDAVSANTWDRNFQRTLEIYDGLEPTSSFPPSRNGGGA